MPLNLSKQDVSTAETPSLRKLKWLMFARVVFTLLLLFTTLYFQYGIEKSFFSPFIPFVYPLIGAIFLLSLLYALLFGQIVHQQLFATFQIGIDSFIVSLIVMLTGGFFSIFTFLYLVVIIYASMILFLRGGLVIALACSVQYAVLVSMQLFEYVPMAIAARLGIITYDLDLTSVFSKVVITTLACFAVAVLSGLLTEQNRAAQQELRAMESHVRRVEKMAYMGEMAAGLAHEIKNPLASLVGAIQLLKEDLHYDPDHQRLMEIVLRETDRLSTLVNEFLLFARPPAGRPKMLDLKWAIEEVLELFLKNKNYTKACNLVRELTPDINVLMDSSHLSQILWNLLLNAVDAVNDGGTVEIHTISLKSNEVQIRIRDDGCGIPEEIMQSIFNPFFTTKSEGTGLGLSIVHRILETYDSRLDIQSKRNGGTTASFKLKVSPKIT